MIFVECYLCGSLAVEESVGRDLTVTIFCTDKLCGRYNVTQSALLALKAGATFKGQTEELSARVYTANRNDNQILISSEDLLVEIPI